MSPFRDAGFSPIKIPLDLRWGNRPSAPPPSTSRTWTSMWTTQPWPNTSSGLGYSDVLPCRWLNSTWTYRVFKLFQQLQVFSKLENNIKWLFCMILWSSYIFMFISNISGTCYDVVFHTQPWCPRLSSLQVLWRSCPGLDCENQRRLNAERKKWVEISTKFSKATKFIY